jgi:hypothetical protein
MIPWFFKRPMRRGDPVATPGFADGIAGMDNAWATLDCAGGYIDWDCGRPTIVPNGSGIDFDSDSWGGLIAAEFWTSLSGDQVTVRAGFVHHGDGRVWVLTSDTEVTLTGSVEYVYLKIGKNAADSAAISVEHSATRPTHTTTTWKWPLRSYELSSGAYRLTGIQHLGGTIHVATTLP